MKFSEIPILMYHEIRDQYDNMMCISQKEFSRQMGLLERQDYKTISLARLKKGVENNEETNEKLVVITFDDGHEGVYSNAYPILRDNGFIATLYVVPSWIDSKEMFTRRIGSTGKEIPLGEQYSAFMSWENLKELSNHGYDIGSHTFSHQLLINLENEALKQELDLADKAIKDNLGLGVKHFCYPYGSFNEQIRELIVTRYDTAVSTIRNFSKIAGAYSRQWVVNNISLDQFSKLLTEPSNEYLGIWLYSSISDKIFQTDRS
tara:strand:- start:27 stop:812 length:786 start_codon:yes stop_codon:yes gene_type:complete